jgi:hypothetical protein
MSSSDIVNGIREAVDAARDMRSRETALRDAVDSGDNAAIVAAAITYVRGEYVEQRDRAAARVQRSPSRT